MNPGNLWREKSLIVMSSEVDTINLESSDQHMLITLSECIFKYFLYRNKGANDFFELGVSKILILESHAAAKNFESGENDIAVTGPLKLNRERITL